MYCLLLVILDKNKVKMSLVLCLSDIFQEYKLHFYRGFQLTTVCPQLSLPAGGWSVLGSIYTIAVKGSANSPLPLNWQSDPVYSVKFSKLKYVLVICELFLITKKVASMIPSLLRTQFMSPTNKQTWCL